MEEYTGGRNRAYRMGEVIWGMDLYCYTCRTHGRRHWRKEQSIQDGGSEMGDESLLLHMQNTWKKTLDEGTEHTGWGK